MLTLITITNTPQPAPTPMYTAVPINKIVGYLTVIYQLPKTMVGKTVLDH